MMQRKTIALAAAVCLASSAGAPAWSQTDVDPLPRRGALGVSLAVDDAGAVVVTAVLDGSSASEAGILAGDTIEQIDGVDVDSYDAVIATVASRRSGALLDMLLARDGESRHATVALKPLPFEQMTGAVLTYGHVTLEDGRRLRTILSVPADADAPSPAVLLIQGGGCGSIDVPWAPTIAQSGIVHAIGSQGFVTLRVDKPGTGDSEGPPCDTIGYRDELEGYRAALAVLKASPAVDPERVFLVGLSLGGFFAPIVAQNDDVAGIAVYGTIAFAPLPYPGRSERFFREIAEVDILAAWSGIHAPVLALNGEYDRATTFHDHETIARLVNEGRTGRAEHRQLARLDHCGTRHPTLAASVDNCGGGEATSELTDTILEFLRAHL